MAEQDRRLPARLGSRRPTWDPEDPNVRWLVALGVVSLVLAIAAATSLLSAAGARRDAADARAVASEAQERASELADELADARTDLQARQGEIEDLQAQANELTSELADAEGAQAEAQDAAEDAQEAQEQASEEAATANTLAEVTTAIADDDEVVAAIHVTDVLAGDTLVGFDLREMLADGPNAGQAITIRLSLIDAPDEGDCRHTQSTSLAEAWLEATDHDVLLRRPAEAPTSDALGQRLAEVVAFANPDASLNVTLAVAGEAVIDEAQLDDDPGLAERLQVAQQAAEGTGRGVWGCTRSELLGVGVEPTPSPTPTGSPTPSPSPTS